MLTEPLTVTQVAAELGVTTQAVSALIRRGRLRAMQVGHVRLIERADLEAYRAAGRQRPGPPPGRRRRATPVAPTTD